MSILGLDIGTTGVKAVVFREDGPPVASAYREYDLTSPRDGHLELDPRAVIAAARAVTGEVSCATRDDPIRSLATSTMGELAVPVDAANRPLGNAIVGFDSRGQEEAAWLAERISDNEVFAITGHTINSAHTLLKILWRRKHDADVFRAAAKHLCFGDFVHACLGAPARIDHSMAARTLAFDVHRKTWSPQILDAAGLGDVFAQPIAAGERVAEVGDNDWGLPKGCVIAGGLHDQPAGILGSAIRPGEAMLATGTVVCLGVRLTRIPDPGPMIANHLCYYPTFGRDQWISIAFNFTGGNILKWYRDQLGSEERAEAERRGVDPYEIICERMPAAPTSLLVLPHFTMTGSPWFDASALGAILGLRITTTRAEIAKALIEGVAFEIKLNAALLAAAGIHIDRYKAIGGAARSSAWLQLYADILERPVVRLEVTEGAALGVALMGARGAGILDSEAAVDAIVRDSVREGRIFEPDPERANAYRARFAIYRDVYPSLRSLTHRLFRAGDA